MDGSYKIKNGQFRNFARRSIRYLTPSLDGNKSVRDLTSQKKVFYDYKIMSFRCNTVPRILLFVKYLFFIRRKKNMNIYS